MGWYECACICVCAHLYIYIYIYTYIYNGSSSLETPEIHIIGARYSQFSDILWMSKASIAKFGNVLAIEWLETLSSSLAPHWIGNLQGVWIPRTRQIAPSVHHWIVYAIVNKVQHLSQPSHIITPSVGSNLAAQIDCAPSDISPSLLARHCFAGPVPPRWRQSAVGQHLGSGGLGFMIDDFRDL